MDGSMGSDTAYKKTMTISSNTMGILVWIRWLGCWSWFLRGWMARWCAMCQLKYV